jgi:AI-2 transport protein TqsA
MHFGRGGSRPYNPRDPTRVASPAGEVSQMSQSGQFSAASRTLITLAAFVVVIAGMKAAEAILVPFVLSIFIALISGPPMFWLERKGLPKLLAMLLVISLIIVIGFLLVVLVGSSADHFLERVPEYQQQLTAYFSKLITLVQHLGIDLGKERLLTYVDPGKAVGLFASTLTSVGGVLTNAFLILFTVVFMLMEATGFPAKLKRALSNPEHTYGYFQTFTDNLQRYMVIKTGVSLVTAVIVGIWLAILGLDYPVLWGVVMFLLNYVPNIGPIIAAIPPALLALVQLGPLSTLGVILAYVVANTLMGNIVEPRYMGRELGLSTLVVFLSLVFWGWVLGPVGMLLSVPLTMAVKIALDSRDETRGLAVLLGPDVQTAPETDPQAQS